MKQIPAERPDAGWKNYMFYASAVVPNFPVAVYAEQRFKWSAIFFGVALRFSTRTAADDKVGYPVRLSRPHKADSMIPNLVNTGRNNDPF